MNDTSFSVRDLASDACLAHDAIRSVDKLLTVTAYKHTDLPGLLGVYQIVTEVRDEADGCLKALGSLIDEARSGRD